MKNERIGGSLHRESGVEVEDHPSIKELGRSKNKYVLEIHNFQINI